MDAVRRLAEAAGVCAEALASATIQSVEGRYHVFRGETWSVQFVPHAPTRVCPHCLAEDEAASPGLPRQAAWRHRIAWRLRPVTCCPKHHLGLVDIVNAAASKDVELSSLLAHGDVGALTSQVRARSPGALQLWSHDRLEGRSEAGGPWLASQTIEQGVRACEMLRATLLHGLRLDLSLFTPDDWDEAGNRSMEVATGGEAAVRAALDEIRAMPTQTAEQATPRATYGSLREWLALASPIPDHGPIRQSVREHMLDHTPYDPGEMLFGEVVTERRLHSAASLSRVLGLERAEAYRRLVRVGMAPPALSKPARNLLVLPARETERLCLDITMAAPLEVAANLLGGTRMQTRSVIDAGVLVVIVDRGSTRGGNRLVVLPRDVADLLERLRRAAPSAKDLPKDAIDLEGAARLAELSIGQVVARLLDGRLEGGRSMRGRSGLSSICIPAGSLPTGDLRQARTRPVRIESRDEPAPS